MATNKKTDVVSFFTGTDTFLADFMGGIKGSLSGAIHRVFPQWEPAVAGNSDPI